MNTSISITHSIKSELFRSLVSSFVIRMCHLGGFFLTGRCFSRVRKRCPYSGSSEVLPRRKNEISGKRSPIFEHLFFAGVHQINVNLYVLPRCIDFKWWRVSSLSERCAGGNELSSHCPRKSEVCFRTSFLCVASGIICVRHHLDERAQQSVRHFEEGASWVGRRTFVSNSPTHHPR